MSRSIRVIWLACFAAGCAVRTAPLSEPAPAGGRPAGASEEAPSLDPAALAREIHALVNQARARHSLPRLAWSDGLADLARAHSLDMDRRDFFAHVNPSGQDATARGTQAGFACRKKRGNRVFIGIGENLFYTTRYLSYTVFREPGGTRRVYTWKDQAAAAREVVEGWMQSPGHRANLLNPGYDAHGIGVVLSEDEVLYVTQNFC